MPTKRRQNYETTDRRQRGKRENQRPDHWQSPTAGRGLAVGRVQCNPSQIKPNKTRPQNFTGDNRENIQPPVQFRETISAPFCTTFCAFCRRTRCKSTTYDRELHHTGAAGLSAFVSFVCLRGEPSRAFPHHAPRTMRHKLKSTLRSNRKITPVKPGQTWSNLKLFPRNNPRARRTTDHAPPPVAAR